MTPRPDVPNRPIGEAANAVMSYHGNAVIGDPPGMVRPSIQDLGRRKPIAFQLAFEVFANHVNTSSRGVINLTWAVCSWQA